MRVFGARCIVKIDKLTNKTTGGLVMPGKDKEDTNRGTIIQIGEGAMLDNGTIVPMRVKVGEKVIFTAYAGTPIVAEGSKKETLVVLNERDILAILD